MGRRDEVQVVPVTGASLVSRTDVYEKPTRDQLWTFVTCRLSVVSISCREKTIQTTHEVVQDLERTSKAGQSEDGWLISKLWNNCDAIQKYSIINYKRSAS